MIGFNGTYLDKASLGEYRITSAAIGGQWVMKPWLKTATQQAIVAAFGAEEGKAVIKATNDYLNAIALTDTARAQQLSAFINEDPLLVCSLVETSKVRWLVIPPRISSDNAVRFELNRPLESTDIIRYRCIGELNWGKREGGSGTQGFFAYHMVGAENLYQLRYYCTSWVTLCPLEDGKIYECEWNFNTKKMTINGSQYNFDYAIINQNPFFQANSKKAWLEFLQIGEHTLCPFIRNGESGMLDLVSFTFYPNANTEGSFTIQLTDKA